MIFSYLPLPLRQAEARAVSWTLCSPGILGSEIQLQHWGPGSNPPNHQPIALGRLFFYTHSNKRALGVEV